VDSYERLTAQTAGARRPVDDASHVPGEIYYSPEIYRQEKELIFMKDWLCVARVEEIEKPGDYMTFDIVGEPIIVARNNDGELRAFGNVCAHRGVEVANGSGNTQEFSCPYHGWLYDLNGGLVGAPYMRSATGFRIADCRLPPIKLDIWAGWIFICFDPKSMPLCEFVAEFDADLGFVGQENCRLAERLVFDLDCNWKLVAENLLDIYHAGTIHAATFGRHISPHKIEFGLKSRGGNTIFYDAAPHTYTTKPLIGKMPWLADRPESFAVTGYMAPNMHFFVRCENMRPCIHWPLSPTKTRLVYYNLFPAEFSEKPGFDQVVQEYRRFYTQVVEEDRATVMSLQAAMQSRQFTPGRMSFLEAGVHHALNYYLDRITSVPS
jgi:phenylpropionate dioxygenase-like ring-hydroxylating dioxygenase large terminal subunit